MPIDLLTIAQAAKIAECNPSTLRYAILRGNLKASKLGKTWLIEPSDFQKWLDDPSMHKRGAKPNTD